MEGNIDILIADDHPIFRKGLRQILETTEGFNVVAELSDGKEAMDGLRRLKPNVAVLDVDMPKMDGFAIAGVVKEEMLPTAIIILTMYKEERFFNAALDAGVKGYVIKDSAITDITEAVRAAADGRNFISPVLSTFLINRLTRAEDSKSPLATLTASERRVLKLVAETKSNKQIADELFISIRTVEHHRSNICAKLDLEGKNALLTFALTNKSEL
jgi:DNA-binding NarL/FixJ family response regulator